ncbi:putative pentatricopeptide repeat-containing protein [Platanthera zijinensis]|uniref:Pentatricopeptide repeat-containing protein n=1 Tax=Platanthera zijinensis TaxID=2320716 RepID=A0AAP0B0N2_9ASPA
MGTHTVFNVEDLMPYFASHEYSGPHLGVLPKPLPPHSLPRAQPISDPHLPGILSPMVPLLAPQIPPDPSVTVLRDEIITKIFMHESVPSTDGLVCRYLIYWRRRPFIDDTWMLPTELDRLSLDFDFSTTVSIHWRWKLFNPEELIGEDTLPSTTLGRPPGGASGAFPLFAAGSTKEGRHQIRLTLLLERPERIKGICVWRVIFLEVRKLAKRQSLQWKSAISISSSPASHLMKNSTHSSAAEAAKFGLISLLASHRNPEISLFSSKGFSEISRLINGKALQCFCLRHASNLSVFHVNTLLSMYFRFGKPSIALNLFDKMPMRNHSTWNTVISGCVRAGRSSVAVDLFRKMREEGGDSNGFMLASLVTACTRDKDMVSRGTQIHGFVLKLGLMSNVYVGTALLHLYGNNDLLTDAQRFFQEMPEKNVVTWTALMVSYSANSQPAEAVRAYRNMRMEGVVCNENSYATVISSCGSLHNKTLSSQILAHVVVSGFEADVSVANSLLTLFGNAGNVDEAEQLFLRMKEKDTISWNSLLSVYLHEGMCEEALLCFARMHHSNFKPDATTFSCTISACANVDHGKWGRGLHSSVVKNNLESSPSVCNTLISMYSAFGKTTDAEMLFRGMPAKDAISWNTMMRSYGQSGDVVGAIELFSKMLRRSNECNHVTFATALAACAGQECLSDGKMIHALVILIGLGESLLVANSLDHHVQ